MSKSKILLYTTVACLFFSGCQREEPCPVCPEITIPFVKKRTWEPLEVRYERIYINE